MISIHDLPVEMIEYLIKAVGPDYYLVLSLVCIKWRDIIVGIMRRARTRLQTPTGILFTGIEMYEWGIKVLSRGLNKTYCAIKIARYGNCELLFHLDILKDLESYPTISKKSLHFDYNIYLINLMIRQAVSYRNESFLLSLFDKVCCSTNVEYLIKDSGAADKGLSKVIMTAALKFKVILQPETLFNCDNTEEEGLLVNELNNEVLIRKIYILRKHAVNTQKGCIVAAIPSDPFDD